MYAVLTTGGKQYRVEAGSTLVVEKVGGEPGSSMTFDRILLVGDGENVTVGSPTVAGASVSATVLGEALGPKIVVFKFKQKVKYRRRTGHRQHLTRLRIDSISADGKTVKAEPPPAAKRKAARPKAAAAAKAEEKPARRRAAKAEPSATAEAEAAPAPRRSRERAAPKAKAAEASEKAPSPARPRRTRASGEAASTAEADEKASSVAETNAETKPRARRTTKPKTESAKEE